MLLIHGITCSSCSFYSQQNNFWGVNFVWVFCIFHVSTQSFSCLASGTFTKLQTMSARCLCTCCKSFRTGKKVNSIWESEREERRSTITDGRKRNRFVQRQDRAWLVRYVSGKRQRCRNCGGWWFRETPWWGQGLPILPIVLSFSKAGGLLSQWAWQT